MKVLVYTLFVGSVISSSIPANIKWENWKTFHGKTYMASEEHHRQEIWKNNMEKIRRHNQEYEIGRQTFRLAMNQFGDLTDIEFGRMYSAGVLSLENTTDTFEEPTFPLLGDITLPDSVDWRQKGLVTSVKNQGSCGSCWAFSAAGSLEGQVYKKTGKLIALSEQQLVDCSSSFGNHGCNGGFVTKAFNYIKKYGIESGQVYPYTEQDDNCKYNKRKVVATIKDYGTVLSGSENALQQAVATVGPISVSIDASPYTFKFYHSGIYNDPACRSSYYGTRHAVLTVGYGSNGLGQEYWIVKNSWGIIWGERGYINIARNAGNRCGIADSPSYPVV
ncbi:cathepsin L2-like [Glandiceps talaboti]